MGNLFIPKNNLDETIEKIGDNSNYSTYSNFLEFRDIFPKLADFLGKMYHNLDFYVYDEECSDHDADGNVRVYDKHYVITCEGLGVGLLDHYTNESSDEYGSRYFYFGYTGHIKDLESKVYNLNRIYKMLTEEEGRSQYTAMDMRLDTYSEIPFP